MGDGFLLTSNAGIRSCGNPTQAALRTGAILASLWDTAILKSISLCLIHAKEVAISCRPHLPSLVRLLLAPVAPQNINLRAMSFRRFLSAIVQEMDVHVRREFYLNSPALRRN